MERNSHKQQYAYAALSLLFFAEKEIFETLPFGVFLAYAPILALADSLTSGLWKRPIILIVFVALGNSVFQVFVHSGVQITDALYSAGSIIVSVLFYRILKIRMNTTVALFGFVLFLLFFDYFNFAWTGVTDRIIIAESFYGVPQWVQWYSITGILGGTLWVAVINILFYFAFFAGAYRQFRWRIIIITMIVLASPIIGSGRWMDSFENKPTYHNIDSPVLTDHWKGVLVAENPENNYNSMLKNYNEYLGRTSVWLVTLLVLSFLVRMKTNKYSNS